jgi:hypothetical protein
MVFAIRSHRANGYLEVFSNVTRARSSAPAVAIEGGRRRRRRADNRIGSFVQFTAVYECFMNSVMELNLSKFIKQPNQWFAGALFALSLLGFIYPHHISQGMEGHGANIRYWHKIQKTNDNAWYTPPRSPTFDDLLGS